MYFIKMFSLYTVMYASIVYYLNLIYWQQIICFKSLNFKQLTSKYSEKYYLCLNNYHCNLHSRFDHLLRSLSVTEFTIGCEYISATLYLLQTYPSGKPMFRDQGSVNSTVLDTWTGSKNASGYWIDLSRKGKSNLGSIQETIPQRF